MVGVGVQLGVAQAVPIVHHRNGVRRALRPLFKQDMGAALRRINFRGSVPTVQQQFALGSRQQIEMRRRLRSICRHRPQHLHRVNAVTLGGSAVEQRGGEVQRTADLLVALRQIERQIILGDLIAQLGTLGLQPGSEISRTEPSCRASITGTAGYNPVARRIDQLHHLLERQIAIFPCRQHRVADPRDQRRQIRIVAKIDAQRQRADEEADQRFGFQPATVGLRRTDHQLLLPGHARQHRAPCRQHRHEQRTAMLPAELPQRLRQLGVNRDRHLPAVERLHRRTRPVGRQRQQRRRIAQRFAPVLRLRRQPLRRQIATLPGGVIRVLQRQRRQRIGIAATESAVQRPSSRSRMPVDQPSEMM